MKERIGVRILSFCILTFLFLGCKDSLVSFQHSMGLQGEGFAVRIFVDGLASGSTRTIAPDHVTLTELADPSKYTVRLTGTSNMGDSRDEVLTVNNKGLGIFLLTPGSWTLLLTVTEVATNEEMLQGKTFVVVENAPTSTNIILKPMPDTGTVSVDFVLSASLLNRLQVQNPTPSTANTGLAGATGQTLLTVALYNGSVMVPGTNQNLLATINGVNTVQQRFVYTGNNQPISAGQYTLRLTASFPKQNNTPETMGYEDIIHIEGGREARATIELSSSIQELGTPNNPARQDKITLGGSSAIVNFQQSTRFAQWGETLWLYGVRWDGDESGENGNEILVVVWSPVYNAESYEVELLIHPFTKLGTTPTTGGKFSRIITSDTEWDALRRQTFRYNNQDRTPIYLRFSGYQNDSNYYKTYSPTIQCLNPSNALGQFLVCADKTLARSLFSGSNSLATGKMNASYRLASAMDSFDSNGVFVYTDPRTNARTTVGKVGLEADCSALGILLPAYTPQMSLVYRVRAVNEFGYSDWVYWKGGKW